MLSRLAGTYGFPVCPSSWYSVILSTSGGREAAIVAVGSVWTESMVGDSRARTSCSQARFTKRRTDGGVLAHQPQSDLRHMALKFQAASLFGKSKSSQRDLRRTFKILGTMLQ